MTTAPHNNPLEIFLLSGDRALPLSGVTDFNLMVESSDPDDEPDDSRPVSRRSSHQRRRRSRASAGDLFITLDYAPLDPVHQALISAGEQPLTQTLRIVTRSSDGSAVNAQEIDCAVRHYTLSLHKSHRRRPLPDGRPLICEAILRLQRLSDFRPVSL